MTVWKFVLDIGRQAIEMPVDAEVLHIAEQHDQVCVWALVSPDAPKAERRFVVTGTGHPVPDRRGRFLGTVLLLDGALVLHVWEAAS